MITRDLMQSRLIRGVQAGHEWRFWVGEKESAGRAALSSALSVSVVTTADMAYAWDTNDPLSCRLHASWVKLGRVILLHGRLTFPRVEEAPGLYRFRIRGPVSEAIYIGESENLVRRFRFYSNPGPSQQTNIRLNAKFYEALSNSTEIGVAIVTVGAWIDFEHGPVAADFHSKAVRRLFESAATVQGMGDTIESLNL